MPQPDDKFSIVEHYRPPITPMWVTLIWAVSPAVLVLMASGMFTSKWPYLPWVMALGGAVNMMAFSLWQLWSRRVESFEFKAIPLGFGMLVLNALLIVAWSAILGIPFGSPAGTP